MNDRIFELERRRNGEARLGDVTWARCECGRSGCDQTLAVAGPTYLSVRSVPTRFVVAPGHEHDGFERIIMEGDRFAVVEVFGRAARTATAGRSS